MLYQVFNQYLLMILRCAERNISKKFVNSFKKTIFTPDLHHPYLYHQKHLSK